MNTAKPHYLGLRESQIFALVPGSVKDEKDSVDNETFIEIANIDSVKSINAKGEPILERNRNPIRANSEGPGTIQIFDISDPDRVLKFDVGIANRDPLAFALMRLCRGDLSYRLLWDERDARQKSQFTGEQRTSGSLVR